MSNGNKKIGRNPGPVKHERITQAEPKKKIENKFTFSRSKWIVTDILAPQIQNISN
jgi:hypothetical protein